LTLLQETQCREYVAVFSYFLVFIELILRRCCPDNDWLAQHVHERSFRDVCVSAARCWNYRSAASAQVSFKHLLSHFYGILAVKVITHQLLVYSW